VKGRGDIDTTVYLQKQTEIHDSIPHILGTLQQIFAFGGFFCKTKVAPSVLINIL
jgi:hypothetical protein